MIPAFLLSFAVTVAILFAIRKLNLQAFAQPQRDFIKHEAEAKAKSKPIPCGGIVFFIIFAIYSFFNGTDIYHFITLFGFFVIGLLDDAGKIMKKSHISFISGKWRLLLEIALAAMFVYFFLGGKNYNIIIGNHTMEITRIIAFPVLIFLIVGTVNAVNLTDGQDALAGKTVLVHLFFLMAFALTGEILVLTGSILAFLLFNSKPATIYMGDAGSMFLGAFLATAFLNAKIEWLLPFTGIVFVVETLSVIIQVTYFKATKGRRIFKMSPFHHHLSLSGMSEEKIVNLAFVITIITCTVSYLLLH
ncbi:MAG: hypothetical protein O3A66_00165 [Proteobacteria bacterium]|nr:hypothetical protein [Pseudomonadota bacterium]